MSAVLYVGETAPGTTAEMRLRALEALGFTVLRTDARRRADGWLAGKVEAAFVKLRRPLDRGGDNRRIRAGAARVGMVWIDKGIHIRPGTLAAVRAPARRPLVIGFSPDDMAARHNNSEWFVRGLPLYDGYITTKSYGVAELTALGCPRVAFVDNAFDPATHRPMPAHDPRTVAYACDVGFVGTYEAERAGVIEFLAGSGIPVTVRGNGWEPLARRAVPGIRILPAVYGDDYARCVSATRVNLTFLRKMNRDLQTTRTVEIPACGGFMLAERTDEQRRLFREGVEAEYFGDRQELLDTLRRYLADEPARVRVAAAGRARCLDDDYSYAARLRAGLVALGFAAALPGESAPRGRVAPGVTP